MDSDRFDRLAKKLGSAVTRRVTLAAIIGAGLAGMAGASEAKDQERRRKHEGAKRRKQARRSPAAPAGDAVAAEATCATPGPSSNLNGCNFNDAEFAGIDVSSSAMKGTKFRRADLSCADLSSSNLKNAEFHNADLTLANLSSSACGGAAFNGAIFCGTRMCNGSVRNDGCPPGVDPDDLCCADDECAPGQTCRDSACCWTSLAAAVGASSSGAAVRLCAGSLTTQGVLINKALTIIGAGSGEDPETDTILDAKGVGRVFLTAFGAGAVEIRDLRVTGGSAGDSGGGILNQSGSTLRLIGVSVVDNTAGIGGGITNDGTLILGNGSRVEGNTATRFGGTGGGIFSRGAVTLEAGSVVTDNTAENGGGVWEASGAVDVANASIVTGNNLNNCRPVGAVPNCTD